MNLKETEHFPEKNTFFFDFIITGKLDLFKLEAE